jgi:hypothetical protein
LRRDVAADAAAILLFTTLGLVAHGFEPLGYVRDALPLLAAWVAVAAAVGLYRGRSRRRLLVCWALAIPLGVLLRARVLGRALDGDQASFLAVTMAFSLAFVVALRAVVAQR